MRAPAEPAKDVRGHQLDGRATGQEPALQQLAALDQRGDRRSHIEPKRARSPSPVNGPCVAPVAADQPFQRVLDRLQERRRQPLRRHRAERIPVEPGILGGDQPRSPAMPTSTARRSASS